MEGLGAALSHRQTQATAARGAPRATVGMARLPARHQPAAQGEAVASMAERAAIASLVTRVTMAPAELAGRPRRPPRGATAAKPAPGVRVALVALRRPARQAEP